MILSIVIATILALYGEIILSYVYRWNKKKEFKAEEETKFISFSIIIPARNEANSILDCLHSFHQMNYNNKQFELIIIDDHSEDKTAITVRNFMQKNPELKIRLIESNDAVQGKKQAIEFAVNIAEHENIISADADCIYPPLYLKTINSFLHKNEYKLVCGPIAFVDEKGFFKQWQRMEFSGLITSTAGAIFSNKPIMSNGANLIFQKTSFKAINSFEGSMQYASGDDISLLMKIKDHFGNKSIGFLKSKDTIVQTKSADSLSQFLNQRVRWTSKSAAYKDLSQIRVSIIVFLSNLIVTGALLNFLISPNSYLVLLFIIGLKIIIDIPLFITNKKYYKLKTNFIQFIINELIIALYTVFIVFYSPFSKRKWKGRKLKST